MTIIGCLKIIYSVFSAFREILFAQSHLDIYFKSMLILFWICLMELWKEEDKKHLENDE